MMGIQRVLTKKQPAKMPPIAPTAMCTIPMGHRGHLGQEQEAKLRALWAIGFKFIDICEGNDKDSSYKTLEEKYVPPAKQACNIGKHKTKTSHTHDKYPMLVDELLAILPTEERNPKKLAKRAVEALDNWTPDMYHLLIEHCVRYEHPDALALRFLRACDWDIIAATTMLGKSIYWRTMEAVVEDDILKRGEGGASEDEKNGQGVARHRGTEFLNQLRTGKAFIHGTDLKGRPIVHIRVRTHRASDQTPETLERFAIYVFEMARLALRSPVETGTVLIDMSGLRPGNIDLSPLKIIIKCIEENYPESIGLILVHNAPLGTRALWKVIKSWVNPYLASKFKFTSSAKKLQKYIALDQIIKELGGKSDWEYRYEEPHPAENILMEDAATREHILERRRFLVSQFENTTREWIMSAQRSDRAFSVSMRRDALAQDLIANYWDLDPYVRARSIYDRQGYFRGADGVKWTPDTMEMEWMGVVKRMDSVGTASASNVDDPADDSSVYSYDTD